MKKIATIEIFILEQGGYKAIVQSATVLDEKTDELYSDKGITLMTRIKDYLKERMGWK